MIIKYVAKTVHTHNSVNANTINSIVIVCTCLPSIPLVHLNFNKNPLTRLEIGQYLEYHWGPIP